MTFFCDKRKKFCYRNNTKYKLNKPDNNTNYERDYDIYEFILDATSKKYVPSGIMKSGRPDFYLTPIGFKSVKSMFKRKFGEIFTQSQLDKLNLKISSSSKKYRTNWTGIIEDYPDKNLFQIRVLDQLEGKRGEHGQKYGTCSHHSMRNYIWTSIIVYFNDHKKFNDIYYHMLDPTGFDLFYNQTYCIVPEANRTFNRPGRDKDGNQIPSDPNKLLLQKIKAGDYICSSDFKKCIPDEVVIVAERTLTEVPKKFISNFLYIEKINNSNPGQEIESGFERGGGGWRYEGFRYKKYKTENVKRIDFKKEIKKALRSIEKINDEEAIEFIWNHYNLPFDFINNTIKMKESNNYFFGVFTNQPCHKWPDGHANNLIVSKINGGEPEFIYCESHNGECGISTRQETKSTIFEFIDLFNNIYNSEHLNYLKFNAPRQRYRVLLKIRFMINNPQINFYNTNDELRSLLHHDLKYWLNLTPTNAIEQKYYDIFQFLKTKLPVLNQLNY